MIPFNHSTDESHEVTPQLDTPKTNQPLCKKKKRKGKNRAGSGSRTRYLVGGHSSGLLDGAMEGREGTREGRKYRDMGFLQLNQTSNIAKVTVAGRA